MTELTDLARKVLATCGPGRILDVSPIADSLVRPLLSLAADAYGLAPDGARAGYTATRQVDGSMHAVQTPDESFDGVICLGGLEDLASGALEAVLRELHRICRRTAFLRVRVGADRRGRASRDWWEDLAFVTGFRRHPAYYALLPYHTLEQATDTIVIPLAKIPARVLARHPLGELKKMRDLHMDMSREAGRRADAHMARYHLAAQYVRDGDTVLDAACGMGYGSWMLACLTPARRVIGADLDQPAIEYARTNFAVPGRDLSFHNADVQQLNFLADSSVDVFVSFETLEHVPDPERVIAEARRVLRPGGRFIGSVPNLWVDEHGKDPNPHHLHVYDWDRLHRELASGLRFEAAYSQTAGGGMKLTSHPRSLTKFLPEQGPPLVAEWWLGIAMKDPVEAEAVPYEETAFKWDNEPPKVVAFAAAYRNPWLARALVSMRWRISDGMQLEQLARRVLESQPPGSVDAGAALCVAAYRLLESPGGLTPAAVASMARKIREHVDASDDGGQGQRWVISLLYVQGRLWQAVGEHGQAVAAFTACAKIDPLTYSPLLATKTVDACRLAGNLSFQARDAAAARNFWAQAIAHAQHALRGDWREIHGDLSWPLSFGLPEAAQILDLAGRCAHALSHLAVHGVEQPVPEDWSFASRLEASDARRREVESRLATLLDTDAQLQRILQHAVFGRLLTAWRSLVNPSFPAPERNAAPASAMREAAPQAGLGRRAWRSLARVARRQLRRFARQEPGSPYAIRVAQPSVHNRPRVIHAIANFQTGGSSRLVADLIENLGHLYDQEVIAGFVPNPPAYSGAPVGVIRDLRTLRAHLRRRKPDLVHIHYWGETDWGWYDRVFRAAGELGCKVVENVNTPVTPYVAKSVERYVYVSDYVLKAFGLGHGHESVIHPGSDFSLFTRPAGSTPPDHCIGMVYRLESDKLNPAAIEPFILVVKRRPATRVLIVGAGRHLNHFRRRVAQSGVAAAFEFTGAVPYGELPGLYARMSVFVAPVWKESFGQVAPFAMSMGLPVAGYAVGALPEVLGGSALLAPAGDSEGLAEIVIGLLDDRAQRLAVGERNRQRAQALFSVGTMVAAFQRVYGDVLGQKA